GIMPARNMLPTETPPITPYKTNGILGGMMTPIDPAEAATADAKPPSYLRAIIAGIIKPPIAATVAGPDPEIAAKNIQATMLTMLNPPAIQPTKADANANSLLETPPFPIRIPASIKNGIASKGNESSEVNAF